MRDAWTWPAYVGVLGGALLFATIFLPVVAWQYRRYGRLSVRRVLLVAAVTTYAVGLVAYTLLPLPTGDLAQWCADHAAGSNTRPLGFLDDVRTDTAGLGVRGTLMSTAVLQVVLNVVLFLPWGVAVRALLRRGVLVATLSGLAASVLIETTQYTGIFGVIPCSYRVADVDDVLMNTLGALLGALVAPLVLRGVPSVQVLEAAARQPRPVTVWRRWTGMLLDWALAGAIGSVLQILWRVAELVTDQEVGARPDVEAVLGVAVPWLVVFVLPALVGDGASWGQRVVWLGPRWDGRVGGVGRRLVRASAVGGAWWLLGGLATVPGVPATAGSLAGMLAALVGFVAVTSVPFSRGRRGISYVWTGAELVDVRGAADARTVEATAAR